MMPVHAAKRYLQMSIQAASKEQILLTLYETAVLEASSAAVAIRCADLDAKSKHIHRVSMIISELMSALDHKAAPELCMQLLQLYLYMKGRLVDADSNLEAEAAEEVTRLLDGLRIAWHEAAAAMKGGERSPSDLGLALKQPQSEQRCLGEARGQALHLEISQALNARCSR